MGSIKITNGITDEILDEVYKMHRYDVDDLCQIPAMGVKAMSKEELTAKIYSFKKFFDKIKEINTFDGGIQILFETGASLIQHKYSMGFKDNLWELWAETNEPIGYLTADAVNERLTTYYKNCIYER